MKIYGVYLKLNEEKDRDIKEKLETVSKKQRYIKNLIREDIQKNTTGTTFNPLSEEIMETKEYTRYFGAEMKGEEE